MITSDDVQGRMLCTALPTIHNTFQAQQDERALEVKRDVFLKFQLEDHLLYRSSC